MPNASCICLVGGSAVMANFTYTAKKKDGSPQKGTVVAESKSAALKALQDRGIQPLVIKQARRSIRDFNFKLPIGGKVKTRELVVFTRQFATMMNAGVPMIRTLSTLRDQTESDTFKECISDVLSKVEGGTQLSEAMSEHPEAFSKVYVNMIRAGEEGGILDQISERLADQVEKDSQIKGKVKSAMIYPAVITLVTIGAFVFIMVSIIPKLASIFQQFEGELPLQTKIMLGISNFMVDNGFFLGVLAVIGIIAFFRFKRTTKGKYMLDQALLRLPIFGKIIMKVNVARFARTFSSLSSAGVSVLDSLYVTSGALSNSVIRSKIDESSERIKEGESIAGSLEVHQLFPPLMTQMASVGEETGQIDVVLEKVAQFYEEEVDRVMSGLTSIIEPILILVLGSMVGLIVASVFGPITSITQQI
ncbi:secretion system protein [Candidatus Saccharibacteria bacterium QS_5_54_17]|nr:MAG: secretion system protein [Candidatus Saccharibacteria bacterium QS_5_54_17]